MLGFYSSTDKIIRIMFIVTVSVIHCWLGYVPQPITIQLAVIYTAPPSYSVNGSIKGRLMTYIKRYTIAATAVT